MTVSIQARESGVDMVFIKHEWGISQFVRAAQSHPQWAVVGKHDPLHPPQADTASAGSSKCELMREGIADFLREVKYALSGDS